MKFYITLKKYNFVIYRYISTMLDGRVHVLLAISCIKVLANICTHCWNIDRIDKYHTYAL